MDVLSSRIIVRPTDPARSLRFYRDVLGLAVARQFGPPETPGTVFFLGGGLLELSGRADAAGPADAARPAPLALWLQVRDATAEHARLEAAGADVRRVPRAEPWGLIEAHVADPDGVLIHLVEVPADHPLRRDRR